MAERSTRVRRLGFALLVTVAGGVFVQSAAAGDGYPMMRVRSSDPWLTALIQEGAERSATLRRLIEAINETDGLVYVEEGQCGHGVRACLAMTVTLAGPYRLLRVLVNKRTADWDLIGSIGHELRHAVEVLSARGVKDHSSMFYFYANGASNGSGSFETQAAIDTGIAVRAEARRR